MAGLTRFVAGPTRPTGTSAVGGPPCFLGVEREYQVIESVGRVDARTIWSTLDALGPRLDPGDPRARRLPTGAVATCDGPEAEIATPPIPLDPSAIGLVVGHAARGEALLAEALLPGAFLDKGLPAYRLVGYSTHLNLSVPDSRVERIAGIIATHLALPLMLALDRAESPGLLVRPRYGRLEVGGDFVRGDQLRAALVWLVALDRLATRALVDRRLAARLRRIPTPRVVPAKERYGWFVAADAFGPLLYTEAPRTVRLPSRRLGQRRASAGELMALLGDLALDPAHLPDLDPADLALARHQAAGDAPLPGERLVTADDPYPCVRQDLSYAGRRVGQSDVESSPPPGGPPPFESPAATPDDGLSYPVTNSTPRSPPPTEVTDRCSSSCDRDLPGRPGIVGQAE